MIARFRLQKFEDVNLVLGLSALPGIYSGEEPPDDPVLYVKRTIEESLDQIREPTGSSREPEVQFELDQRRWFRGN